VENLLRQKLAELSRHVQIQDDELSVCGFCKKPIQIDEENQLQNFEYDPIKQEIVHSYHNNN